MIGYLEPHGRAETAAQAEGLEVVPRRRVGYRDTALEEMDLPAVLSRAPELASIDELAHTNAPGPRAREALRGRRGRARRRDRRVLDASTSSTSRASTTRSPSSPASRVRETVPDAVLPRADEIVLVDLTPRRSSSACARARSIRPSASGRAQQLLPVENLAALREVALRQVAEQVEAKRLPAEARGRREERIAEEARRRRSASGCSRWSSPSRARSGSCAARGARLSASARELDLLWVAPPGRGRPRRSASSSRPFGSWRRVLGAHLLVEPATTSSDRAACRARARHARTCSWACRSPRGALARLREPGLPSG